MLLTCVGQLVSPDQLLNAQSSLAISRQEFTRRLVAAAIERTHHSVRYLSEYVRIPYPGGDVPADTGVCTDEIIRSYRAVGIDLQKEVHEDMVRNFAAYPNKRNWLLSHPDSNIDHRRVPNLMVFFARRGESLPISSHAEDYAPGDLVTWDLGRNVPHIGIVVDQKALGSGRFMIVHNVGEGPKMEDVLWVEDYGALPILRTELRAFPFVINLDSTWLSAVARLASHRRGGRNASAPTQHHYADFLLFFQDAFLKLSCHRLLLVEFF